MMRARWILSALLLAAATVLTLGSVLERSGGDHHAAETAHVEASGEGQHRSEGFEPVRPADERASGLNIESARFVAFGVAISVALAAAVFRWHARSLLLIVIGLAFTATTFDVAEIARQLGQETRPGLAALGLLAAALHLAVAAVAGQRWMRPA